MQQQHQTLNHASVHSSKLLPYRRQGILPEPELRALLAAQHRPNYVQNVLSAAIEVCCHCAQRRRQVSSCMLPHLLHMPGERGSSSQQEANIPDAARVRLDENVMMFSDTTGACERILKTPIPLTYTR